MLVNLLKLRIYSGFRAYLSAATYKPKGRQYENKVGLRCKKYACLGGRIRFILDVQRLWICMEVEY